MWILQAKPTPRDTKTFLDSFGACQRSSKSREAIVIDLVIGGVQPTTQKNPVIASILDQHPRRTALVKLQGPFTDRQLTSIARGIVSIQAVRYLVIFFVLRRRKWIAL